MRCLSLWPKYIGEKKRTLGKTYGIKERRYWEHNWEPIGNKGNMKKTFPPKTQNFKKIKIKTL
jgi:hypothetical protein